jgi:hypothetical protein
MSTLVHLALRDYLRPPLSAPRRLAAQSLAASYGSDFLSFYASNVFLRNPDRVPQVSQSGWLGEPWRI